MAYPKTITPKNNAIIQGIEGIQIWDTHVLSFAFAGEAEKSIALDTLDRYGSSGQFHALDTADAVATDFRNDFMISIAGYSHIANLTFTAASEFDSADLKFTGIDNLDHGNTAGVTSFPGRDHKAGGGFESYLFINTDGSGMHLSHELGGSNFAISVIIHEMGHTLGLAHPHDTGNGSTKWASSSITASDDPLDNERYTVMSYEGGGLDVARARHGGHPVTPMALDVAAIQHMYGAVANFTGDTAYTMTDAKTAPLDLAGDDGTISIGRAFYCIWDTGGSDTIDYNGSDNALIDLKAATLSRTDNAATQAWIDELSSLAFFGALPKELRDDISNAAYHAGGFFSRIFDDSGNVQLGGYSIAKGAGIENGVGAAGNDVLIGNHLANHLTGNDGADVILGNHGADVLDGGTGADIFVFASENDSHNRKHDSITGFDAAHDKIDLWFAVTGVDPTVSANKFNHIDNAANAAHLAPGHAILVDVGADTYLLVDVNGAAGYQAGEDLIVQMNGVAAVTAGDFICRSPEMAHGFHINITYAASVDAAPAEFKAVIEAAVQFLENQFDDPITVNIKVAYKSISGLGESSYGLKSYTYSQIVNALQADTTTADDATAVASLPAGDPIGGTHRYYMTPAEAKALGLLAAHRTALDGTVTFDNSANLFDYDKSDGIAAGKYDFFGSVLHELTEVMGREMLNGHGNHVQSGPNNGYYPLDLFHFSAPGARSFIGSQFGYFSIDGGDTNLNNFYTHTDGDWGDWAHSAGNDSFRAFSNSGVVNRITHTDLKEMDILGYDRLGVAAATGNDGPNNPHLVVDANGAAGYHAGEHMVVPLDDFAAVIGDFV